MLLDAAQNITLTFSDGGGPIENVSHHKRLGVVVDCRVKWDHHVNYNTCRRLSSNMRILRSHCSHLPVKCRRLFYTAYILPILLHSCTAWTNINSTLSEVLETHHRFLLRTRFSQDSFVSNKALYKMTSACPSISHRHRLLCILVHKIELDHQQGRFANF